ncbi:MAG: ATP-binding cassette domain-containing protein, partial [Saprospiraceae bacterium]|nr:ATP-binding cassette domain-containing protein [Saprospiraceae bacterium]
MSNEIRVRVSNLSKCFELNEHRTFELKAALTNLLYRRFGSREKLWALRDLSFEVGEGEVLGIVGRNGSGKSTLLKILSKITVPTSGKVELWGRTNTLLEVGTGFHHELTGRENIYLNGSILGMSRAEIRLKFDEIVAFAAVEKFLDTPMKHFSSGMYVRLAFAVAAHLDPDLLIVDEVLAVGDQAFQKKCLQKMEEEVLRGRTVLFVSHDMRAIEKLCKRVILLEQGRIITDGPTNEVVKTYMESFHEALANRFEDPDKRQGTGHIRFSSLYFEDAEGSPSAQVEVDGDVTFVMGYSCVYGQPADVVFRIGFKSLSGNLLFRCISTANAFTASSASRSHQITCRIPKLR